MSIYNKIFKDERDKSGKIKVKEIALERKDKGTMNFKEVEDIYQQLLNRGYTYDKISISVANPYMNFFTIKSFNDVDIIDFGNEEYWMNKSQEIREKLEEFQFVYINVKV